LALFFLARLGKLIIFARRGILVEYNQLEETKSRKMQYKLIIFDLDGTAIPNKPDGLPSGVVVGAVVKAKKKVAVSVATGRAITMARPILKKLKLTTPCILSGGAQIINPKTEEVLWERLLAKDQIKEIINVLLPYSYEVSFSNETSGRPAKLKSIKEPERIVYVVNVKNRDSNLILKKLNNLENIAAHGVKAWTEGCTDIHITNSQATKKFALEVLFDMIGVEKSETIGVGDSNNDLPLLEMVGFKVAVGNASKKLKETADYIAPPVENDGLAEVIEKFILKRN